MPATVTERACYEINKIEGRNFKLCNVCIANKNRNLYHFSNDDAKEVPLSFSSLNCIIFQSLKSNLSCDLFNYLCLLHYQKSNTIVVRRWMTMVCKIIIAKCYPWKTAVKIPWHSFKSNQEKPQTRNWPNRE